MNGVPVTSKPIYVSMVQTGCLKAEFDSTYPIRLNGIVSQEEFRQSIDRINHEIPSNKILIVPPIIFAVSMIGGIIFFIIDRVTSADTYSIEMPPLLIVGIVITVVGSILFTISCIVVQFRRASKICQAIAEESKKYSSRSTPCHWRFEAVLNSLIRYKNDHNVSLGDYLVINIGHSNAARSDVNYSNQVVNESTILFENQESDVPPPYHTLSH